MKKNIVIDLVNNKTTADSLMLYDAVRLEVITGIKDLFSVREDKIPKLIIAWHRFPLLEEPNNWMISEDGSSATLEFVLKSFGIKDSFVHIPAKGFRLFEFNIIIPKNNVAVASVRINVQNNTLEGIPFSQQDRDKLDSIDLTNYYTKVEVDNKFASFDPGTGGAVYTFTKPLNVDTNNVVSIDLTEYAKLTDLPNIPTNLSSFTNDTGFITKSALNGYATEYFVTSRGYITAADIPEIPTIPTNISSFTNDAGYITIKDVPSVDLTPYALKSELFSKSFNDLTDTPTTLAGYGITDANISGRKITIGGNSITVPESSGGGGGGDYTLTKEAVDGVIGASTAGSTAKFYNEQGAFTEVDMSGYLPLSGGTMTGYLNLGGEHKMSEYDPDWVGDTYIQEIKMNGKAYGNQRLEIGIDVQSNMRFYGIGFTTNTGELNTKLAGGFTIVARDPIGNARTSTLKGLYSGLYWNNVLISTVDDISTHNTDTTSHADLFALKVDVETYNTAITAINTSLEGKENTGVAQGLVDAHNESATAHEALFEAKADKTDLESYLPLSGGTITGGIVTSTVTDTITSNAERIIMCGGSTYTKGGNLRLYGDGYAGAMAGGAALVTFANETQQATLQLTPDGKGSWNGADLSCITASDLTRTAGYIRYSNGFQICWGVTSAMTAGENNTINFPVAFNENPNVFLTRGSGATTSSNGYWWVRAAASTYFYLYTTTTASFFWYAIGKWK